MEKRPSASTLGPLVVLLVLWLMMYPALGCPYDGSRCKDCLPYNSSRCKDCILKQMKCGCPSCVPVLRCMARCLWGGSSRANCIRQCDCGTPKLSDCKKCISRCKCSCMT